MDKAKILRLCDEIEDNAKEIRERTVKNSYFMAQTIINRVFVICSEITAPPKSNADRIRQMTDEELAKIMRSCKFCAYLDKGCHHNGTCTQGFLEWLKQEVSKDAGTD